jgi:hypothetical protein
MAELPVVTSTLIASHRPFSIRLASGAHSRRCYWFLGRSLQLRPTLAHHQRQHRVFGTGVMHRQLEPLFERRLRHFGRFFFFDPSGILATMSKRVVAIQSGPVIW